MIVNGKEEDDKNYKTFRKETLSKIFTVFNLVDAINKDTDGFFAPVSAVLEETIGEIAISSEDAQRIVEIYKRQENQ